MPLSTFSSPNFQCFLCFAVLFGGVKSTYMVQLHMKSVKKKIARRIFFCILSHKSLS